MKQSIRMHLPDGADLVVNSYQDEVFPSIDISLEQSNGDHETVCFVEFNFEREAGKELC